MEQLQSQFQELLSLTYLHLKNLPSDKTKLLVAPELYAFFKEEAKKDFHLRQKEQGKKEEGAFIEKSIPSRPPEEVKPPSRKIAKKPEEKKQEPQTSPSLIQPIALQGPDLTDVETLFAKLFPKIKQLPPPQPLEKKPILGKQVFIHFYNENPQTHRFLQTLAFALEKSGCSLAKEADHSTFTLATPNYLKNHPQATSTLRLEEVEVYAKEPMKKKELWLALLRELV